MNDPYSTRGRSRSGDVVGVEALLGRWQHRWHEQRAFLQGFLRRPTRTGALFPSSPALARSMIQGFGLRTAETVVELGPGTGAFTRLLVEEVGPDTLVLTLELDEHLARMLRKRFPSVVTYCDSAERLRRHLNRLGKKRANYVISGLPWATFPGELQDRVLGAVVRSLVPDGQFSTFAYVHALLMPAAIRFRRRLQASFGTVEMSRVVWRNLPPALVYRCRDPRPRERA